MSRQLFEVMVRRQPGYELFLTVRFTTTSAYGALSLARKDWQESRPGTAFEVEDVRADELRGGRFTLIHPSTDRREGYSLARLTEDLLAKISDTEWTELEPVTEFGFRYLQIPATALGATPPSAAVRTRSPAPTPAPSTPPTPSAGGGSLLDRARHSGRLRGAAARPTESHSLPPSTPIQVAVATPPVTPAPPVTPVPPDTPAPPAGEAPLDDDVPETIGRMALPPKPRPVASASHSGTPSPGRRIAAPRGASSGSLPGSLPPRPVPVESSLADAAFDELGREDAVARLRAEMQKVWDLHLRLEEVERRLADSLQREADLLDLLQRWQAREAR